MSTTTNTLNWTDDTTPLGELEEGMAVAWTGDSAEDSEFAIVPTWEEDDNEKLFICGYEVYAQCEDCPCPMESLEQIFDTIEEAKADAERIHLEMQLEAN